MTTLEGVTTEAVDTARIVSFRVAEAPQSVGTIMLVEPEPLLADSIKYTLEREGFRVVAPATVDTALEAITLDRPGLILVDVASAKHEVMQSCRALRAATAGSIILMTAPLSDADRSDALHAGADDFLVKPFSVREVVQCVTHHVRKGGPTARSRDSDAEILRIGPVEMDVANHEVRVRGQLTVFPPKEFGLLEALLRGRGRLLTRARLIATVWGADYYGDGKTLDTHVKRLRQKIELDPKRPSHLIVVRGLGYRLLDSAR
jgi:two-component system response regulator RegX3